MSMPRIALSYSFASSAFLASFTPPALPRPPILTWALTTVTPPSFSAAALASSGVSATIPASTGTPCASNRSRAWYSYRSTGLQSFLHRQRLNEIPGSRNPPAIYEFGIMPENSSALTLVHPSGYSGTMTLCGFRSHFFQRRIAQQQTLFGLSELDYCHGFIPAALHAGHHTGTKGFVLHRVTGSHHNHFFIRVDFGAGGWFFDTRSFLGFRDALGTGSTVIFRRG